MLGSGRVKVELEGKVSVQGAMVSARAEGGGGGGGILKLSRTTNFSSELISLTIKSSGLDAHHVAINEKKYKIHITYVDLTDARKPGFSGFTKSWMPGSKIKLGNSIVLSVKSLLAAIR